MTEVPIKSQNVKKLVGILTENARLPTKRIATRMRCSQQLVSYLIGRLNTDTGVSLTIQADVSKLGFEQVIVGIRYKRIVPERIRALIAKMREEPHITLIVQGRNGVDLLVEFTSPNLSAFSKELRNLLSDQGDLLDLEFVMPIIVRRVYPRSYLNRSKREVKILYGDRQAFPIAPADRLVLGLLQTNARLSLLELSRRSSMNTQAIRTSIARLESDGILRGFSLRGDIGSIGITTSWLLLRLPSEGLTTIDQVVSSAEADPHVIEIIKMIGAYHVMVRIEEASGDALLRELRTRYDIERSVLVESHSITLESSLPRNEHKE